MQVSDQPQAALERSALEAKDRGELMTIATAMGGKPGSRAKKADNGFRYLGLVLPITHEGSKPMSVTFRLLTPLNDALRTYLGVR